jgi:succinoglycan biosynthesis transport protein ExoP
MFEVLSGKMSAEEVIWTDQITNLAFLPVVMKSRVPHTGDILGAARMRQLFDSLREHYDYVVVDLSPLSPVIDVRATPHFVDSYIYVIEWGQTKTEVVEAALESARGVYDRLLGVVLNKTDMNLLRRFENYRGHYYGDRYDSRYG